MPISQRIREAAHRKAAAMSPEEPKTYEFRRTSEAHEWAATIRRNFPHLDTEVVGKSVRVTPHPQQMRGYIIPTGGGG